MDEKLKKRGRRILFSLAVFFCGMRYPASETAALLTSAF